MLINVSAGVHFCRNCAESTLCDTAGLFHRRLQTFFGRKFPKNFALNVMHRFNAMLQLLFSCLTVDGRICDHGTDNPSAVS